MATKSLRSKLVWTFLFSLTAALLQGQPAIADDFVSVNYVAPTRTADGFTASKFAPIPNIYSQCRLSTTTAITAGWFYSDQSVITVGGLLPGQASQLEIDYVCELPTRTIVTVYFSGTALQREGLVPMFGAVRSVGTGFYVDIMNYDSAFTFTVSASNGNVVLDRQIGRVTVSGIASGANSTITVETSRTGYESASATVDGAASAAPPTPIATSPISTIDGFRVRITNKSPFWDPFFRGINEVWPAGVTIQWAEDDTATFFGLAPGQQISIELLFNAGGGVRSQPLVITGSALPALAAPLYPSAFAQSATSAFVTWGSVEGATGYTVTASNGGGTCSNTINYCTVTGLTAGQSYTFSIVATRNGQSGPAAVTAPVLMASALDVGGSLTSSTWKVGAVVVANPLIIGQYSIVRHQWYRCATAVAVQEAAPACEAIAGATGGTYTLTAADLGKYVTSHLTVTGGAGVVTATLANTRVVLAANAAGGALVDPDGKPLIAEIPTRQISVVGGTTITITGTGFTGVTSVLVNGAAATVLSATDTTLIISVPASTQVGLVDLAVTTPKGTVTEASALAYVAKQASISSKKKTLTGFSGSATKLSTKQKAEIKAFVKANPTMPKLTCAATTVGVKKSSTEAKAALARAKAACSYAASVSKNVFTSSNGAQGKTTGKVSKLVTLTISN